MNKSFDHLLRDALAADPGGEARGPCLDAELAAAWLDGMLGREARAAAELHAAGCQRCQALLAAMVQTTPALPGRAWWRAPATRWLAPIAAAASVLVWVNLPPRAAQPPTATSSEVAEARPAGPGAVSPPPGPLAQSRPAPAPAAAPPEADPTRRESTASTDKAARARAARPAAPLVAVAPGRKEIDGVADASTVPSPPPAASNTPAAAASPPPSAAPQPSAPRPEAAQAAVDSTPVAPLGETLSVTESARLRSSLRDSPRELVVGAPEPRTRWRASGPGRVQRTTDGGATWETQTTGVEVMPTAGASPSAGVCWLVGPGGVVLLSVDGRSWARVPFPEPVDLLEVSATAADAAIVFSADGRRFETSDRGRTWRQLPRRTPRP